MLDSKLIYSFFVFGMDFIKNINKQEDENFIRFYQSHIGTYIWAYICNHSNFCFTVLIFSKFLLDLTFEHMIAVKQLYQYLQTIKNLKIVYCDGLTQHFYLEVYTDIDSASDKETCRSTSAYVAMLADCLVFWSSKKGPPLLNLSRKLSTFLLVRSLRRLFGLAPIRKMMLAKDLSYLLALQ